MKKIFEEANQKFLEEEAQFDAQNPFDGTDDLTLEENIFDVDNLQNEKFIDVEQQDKQPIVQIEEQTNVYISSDEPALIAEEKPEEEAIEKEEVNSSKNIENNNVAKSQDEKQSEENSERKYGKFKNPEELLHAYGELEKEFTRRSQRLKELENANQEPFSSEEEWKAAVDKFFLETPSAKAFAKDIANEIIAHPELKKDRNCLSVALTRALVSKFRTPEQLMSDGQFLKDYVLCSKEVKDAVIAEYLQDVRKGQAPFIMSGAGMQCVTNPKRPRTIEEAGFMFLKDNK